MSLDSARELIRTLLYNWCPVSLAGERLAFSQAAWALFLLTSLRSPNMVLSQAMFSSITNMALSKIAFTVQLPVWFLARSDFVTECTGSHCSEAFLNKFVTTEGSRA